METGPSRTAMAAAVMRGRHRLEDAPPPVFDDPFALDLVGPVWRRFAARGDASRGKAARRELTGGILVRSRYAEDRLALGGQRQYVILGAGLDTFGWRHADPGGALRVFEVDHPDTQGWKRERALAAGLAPPPAVVEVPVDFEVSTLREGLDAAGFAWEQPAFFSWLGVTMYLTLGAVEATLRTVSECAAGSEVVFTYGRADQHLDAVGREVGATLSEAVARVGEPLRTRFSRDEAEALVRRCGLGVAEHPDRDELVARYFAAREDGLRPYTAEGLIAARA
jgi:methyltransferase (TIGR00027 family)